MHTIQESKTKKIIIQRLFARSIRPVCANCRHTHTHTHTPTDIEVIEPGANVVTINLVSNNYWSFSRGACRVIIIIITRPLTLRIDSLRYICNI